MSSDAPARADSAEAEDAAAAPVARLPPEILAHVLAHVAIDRPQRLVDTILLGRALWLPPDSALFWEPLCRHAYPEVADGSLDVARYGSYHALFRQRPTLRFPGVYVCMSRYFRDGEVEGVSFYRPKHEVRYYRYLWLSRDGRARSLLSNYAPRRVLRLEPGAAAPALTDAMQGHWSLDKDTNRLHVRVDGGAVRNHAFFFEFEIASSGGKVHNKLKWKRYWCAEHTTGAETEISLKNEGSYYFQRLDNPESLFQ